MTQSTSNEENYAIASMKRWLFLMVSCYVDTLAALDFFCICKPSSRSQATFKDVCAVKVNKGREPDIGSLYFNESFNMKPYLLYILAHLHTLTQFKVFGNVMKASNREIKLQKSM